MRALPVFFVFLALALVVLYNACFVVPQTKFAVVTQFGNPVATVTEPGLKFKTPFTQTVEFFDNRLLEYSMPEEIEINSSDKKRILLGAFVRWRIVDPLAFMRATSAAGVGGNRISAMDDKYLSNWLGSAMRQVIGNAKLGALLSPERDRIMHDIRDLMNSEASGGEEPSDASVSEGKADLRSGYGLKIEDVRIVKADLPAENSAAIFKRMQTERQREALSYRAEGSEESQGIKAKADRDATIILAEADRQSEILRGDGDAEAARIFAEAFGKDPDFFEFYRSMQAYDKALDPKDTTIVLSPNSPFLKEFGGTPKR